MRLGVDGREFRLGVRTGIARYLLEVLRAASRAGWSCVVYGDAGARLDDALPGIGFRVLRAPWTQWWDQVSLPRALARDHTSVFLSPYYKGPLNAPCPVVLTIHDLYFIGYPGRRRPVYDATITCLARLYAARSTAIVTDSEYSKRSIVTRLGVSSSKVSVIPVALGPEFRPVPRSPAVTTRYGVATPYILYVGNFMPHKNLPRFIRAFALLPAEQHEVVADAGLLFDAEREGELAAALARVLSDAGLAEDLRRRAVARAGLFTPERTSGRVLDVLRVHAGRV